MAAIFMIIKKTSGRNGVVTEIWRGARAVPNFHNCMILPL